MQPFKKVRPAGILRFHNLTRAVGSLVVRASDSRQEGLGSMPDATKYPPSTHGGPVRIRDEFLAEESQNIETPNTGRGFLEDELKALGIPQPLDVKDTRVLHCAQYCTSVDASDECDDQINKFMDAWEEATKEGNAPECYEKYEKEFKEYMETLSAEDSKKNKGHFVFVCHVRSPALPGTDEDMGELERFKGTGEEEEDTKKYSPSRTPWEGAGVPQGYADNSLRTTGLEHYCKSWVTLPTLKYKYFNEGKNENVDLEKTNNYIRKPLSQWSYHSCSTMLYYGKTMHTHILFGICKPSSEPDRSRHFCKACK
ncbi:hypothetical protein TNCV_4735831 [Trichonephila clavipes]|nr:hypothetical protein TNCV_4735831 [Trichonephila clavipes]